MQSLCKEEIIIRRSADPKTLFMYSPSILKLPSGRLLFSYDISDKDGEILASDDGGKTWTKKAHRIFHHARLFRDGDRVYVLGVNKDIVIFVSEDEGETWSEGTYLTQDERWQGNACEVHYKDGYLYMELEQILYIEGEFPMRFWPAHIMAPVVIRGKCGTDLTKRENWLFSERVRYCDLIDDDAENNFGVPFIPTCLQRDPNKSTGWIDVYRNQYDYENDTTQLEFVMNPGGWLEGNIVRITDPHHYWHDPTGKTLHIFMRAHTGCTGYACMMKAVERLRDGKEVIDIEPEHAPSGKKMVFFPFPGGQMRFHVKYDEITKLYWLASTQARDSMTRLEYLDPERYNIPNDERDRLVLYFSKNMVDWVFAGLIAKGNSPREARHYASMEFDGDDLLIASRSGDKDALDPHCGNIVTLHRIENFRSLIY